MKGILEKIVQSIFEIDILQRFLCVQHYYPLCDTSIKFNFLNFFFCSDIVYNAEFHIRIFEFLLKAGDWGEILPTNFEAPGMYLYMSKKDVISYESFIPCVNPETRIKINDYDQFT